MLEVAMTAIPDGKLLSAPNNHDHFPDDSLLISAIKSSQPSRSTTSDSPISVLEVAELQLPRRSCSNLSNDSEVSSSADTSLNLEADHLEALPSSSERCQESPTHFTQTFSHKSTHTFKEHRGNICSLAVRDKLVYSGSDKSIFGIWRSSDMNVLSSFLTGDGAMKAVIMNENTIFSAHQDRKIRVWRHSKTRSGNLQAVATLPTVKNYMMSFIRPKNYVQVRRHHKRLWIAHSDTISALALGKGVLYSASWDKTVRVWRLKDYLCLELIQAHNDAVNALVVARSGHVFTGAADSRVKSWSRLSKKKHGLVSTMEGHKSGVNALALSANESLLYSGSNDTFIVVWERQEDESRLRKMESLTGHGGSVLCLAAIANGVCSGSADKTIRVWGRKDGGLSHECFSVLQGHAGAVRTLAIGEDEEDGEGLSIYCGSGDRCLNLWRIPLRTDHASISDSQQILQTMLL